MRAEKQKDVSHDGDIVKVAGRALRMEYMVRDAFWADDRAIVLLDPTAFLDHPAYGSRKRSRNPVHNLRAYSPSGKLLWQAEQPELDDHYYMIENQAPLVALSFSAFRCDVDLETGRILRKESLK
jgi:hypothetical protein